MLPAGGESMSEGISCEVPGYELPVHVGESIRESEWKPMADFEASPRNLRR